MKAEERRTRGLASAGPSGAACGGLACLVVVNHYTIRPATLGKV
jgi:hypothetical protein